LRHANLQGVKGAGGRDPMPRWVGDCLGRMAGVGNSPAGY